LASSSNSLSYGTRFIYYFGAYIFFYSVATMVQIPYSALSADMTNEPEERNALVGIRLIFSMGYHARIRMLSARSASIRRAPRGRVSSRFTRMTARA
jgi:Na+/melibiose symporter-like transporter